MLPVTPKDEQQPPNTSADAELASGSPAQPPVFVKKQPLWTYFLTPAAVVIGAVIIAGAIWWTADDDSDEVTTADHDGDAVSMVPTPGATAAAGAAAGLLDTFRGYAKQVGLNETQYNQCVTRQSNVATLNDQLQRGNQLGVTGTPTFFINNKKLVGSQPLAVLQEIVQKELDGSPTSLDGYSAQVRALASTNPPNFAIVDSKPSIMGAEIKGDATAKVMIVEFSDFQCPFCRQWTQTSMEKLEAQLGEDVALAFLHFPITQIHPNAGNASVVALCAGEQGKFWEMHDLLFDRQAEWSNLK